MKENSGIRERAVMAMWSRQPRLRHPWLWAVLAALRPRPASGPARADEPSPAAAAPEIARLQAEVDRLKQELREQRQLILQLMQAEQQRYDIVLKYLQAGGGGDASNIPPPPSAASVLQKGGASEAKEGAAGASGGGRESATITGHVRTNGQPIGEAYVFVDGPRRARPAVTPSRSSRRTSSSRRACRWCRSGRGSSSPTRTR